MGLASVFFPSTDTKVETVEAELGRELVCDKLMKGLSSRYGAPTRFNYMFVIGELFLDVGVLRVFPRV